MQNASCNFCRLRQSFGNVNIDGKNFGNKISDDEISYGETSDQDLVILSLFSNVKLQFTCKKPTEQRIRPLLRVFLLPTMETSQKIRNIA